MNLDLGRAIRLSRFSMMAAMIGACLSLAGNQACVAAESASRARQPAAVSACQEVDLSLSLIHARWLPLSRGPVRIMEATFRLRNQGAKNSSNPTMNFRPVSRLQGYVGPQPMRLRPIPAGQERLVPVMIPVFVRQNAAVQFPELIASVSPESPRRDCNPANNQARVYPLRSASPPPGLFPGSSVITGWQSAGLGCVVEEVVWNLDRKIAVVDAEASSDGGDIPETEPADQ